MGSFGGMEGHCAGQSSLGRIFLRAVCKNYDNTLTNDFTP